MLVVVINMFLNTNSKSNICSFNSRGKTFTSSPVPADSSGFFYSRLDAKEGLRTWHKGCGGVAGPGRGHSLTLSLPSWVCGSAAAGPLTVSFGVFRANGVSPLCLRARGPVSLLRS